MGIGKIIQLLVDVFCPLALGFLLRHRGWMDDRGCRFLMLVNVIGLLTTMNLLSFWLLPIDWALILIPALSLLTAFLSGGLAAAFFARHMPDDLQKGSYVMASMLSNIGTMAGLASYMIFGQAGFAYTQLFATPQNILMVVFAFPLAQYYRNRYLQKKAGSEFHFSFRKVLLTLKQLGVLGMAAGLWLHWQAVPEPEFLKQLFPVLIHVRAWIAFLPVGYQLDFGEARNYYCKILGMLPLKFLVVPALIYGLARLHFTSQELLGTILLDAAAPVAINAVVTSTLFQLDVDLTVASFILTTASYIVLVVPLFYLYIRMGGML